MPQSRDTDQFLESFKPLIDKLNDLVNTANVSYMDAAIELCEKNGLEVEFIGELIAQDPDLKAKLESEAKRLHFLKDDED